MNAVPGLPPTASVIPLQLPPAPAPPSGFTPLAAQIVSGALLEPATTAILERIIAKALDEPNGATKLATLILDRSLPPPPTRADAWWEENHEKLGIEAEDDLGEVTRKLRDAVHEGTIPPCVACELIGYFRVFELAGRRG